MRIGILLRHYGQHEGGVRVYTHNLLPLLLDKDRTNTYVLAYDDPKFLGTYGGFPSVEEEVLKSPFRLLWDQVEVPRFAKRKKLDLIFNPKFTAPLVSKTRTVIVMHGPAWFVIPETFPWHDRLYARLLVPRYCQRAEAVIAVSNAAKRDVIKFTRVDPKKVFTIHNGFHPEHFRRIEDRRILDGIREKYHLPEQFVLWVGQIYPPKNVPRLLKAFASIRSGIPHHLVLAGEKRGKGKEVYGLIDDLGLRERVTLTEWVPHEDLPAFYSLADMYVLPSLYEGFGIPLIEAMACGCPVLTSTTGSSPEVVGEAGYLVDPYDEASIAAGMLRILSEPALRREMVQRGLERAQAFSWEKCATQVLEVLQWAAGAGRPSPP